MVLPAARPRTALKVPNLVVISGAKSTSAEQAAPGGAHALLDATRARTDSACSAEPLHVLCDSVDALHDDLAQFAGDCTTLLQVMAARGITSAALLSPLLEDLRAHLERLRDISQTTRASGGTSVAANPGPPAGGNC